MSKPLASAAFVACLGASSAAYEDKTVIVTCDDGKTDVNGLVAATTNAGYPSAPRS